MFEFRTMFELRTKLLLKKDEFEFRVKSLLGRKIFEFKAKALLKKKGFERKNNPLLLYGFNMRDIVFECPHSLRCLMDEEEFLECSHEKGKESCMAWKFKEELKFEAPAFWGLILKFFNEINVNRLDKRLLTVGIKNGLEIEKKHSLSLLLLSLGTLWAQNNFSFLPITEKFVERVNGKIKFFSEIFQEISKTNPALAKILSKEFEDLLVSDFSRKGILFLTDISSEAIKESQKPIPEASSEKMFSKIKMFLDSQK